MPNYRRTYGANAYYFTVVTIPTYTHPQRRNTGAGLAVAAFSPINARGSDAGAVGSKTEPTLPADRLHFILDLFRCYADRANLFHPPFSPEQVRAITKGCLPEERL